MKRYYDLNSYFKSLFGQRVHKITVDAGLSCPNRDGEISTGGCIYCNQQGSGNGLAMKGMPITEQIKKSMIKVGKRFKAKKFIAYFQSFSNTYAPIEQLEQLWEEALKIENVVGLAIGTRPDCVNKSVINLLGKYTRKYLIWLEYGLQSANKKTLDFINRGHNVDCFNKAVKLAKQKNINVCTHVILGLPGESHQTMLKTANFLSKSNIDGIKIHLLYVIKNTQMEKLYKTGKYKCLTQKEYVTVTCDFIERLAEKVVVQRLTSDPNPNELVAPLWTTQKKSTLDLINDELERRNTWQGKKVKNLTKK